MDPNKIGIGISTWAGVLGSIALVFLGVLQPLQDSLEPFGVDPNMFTWAGAALMGTVVLSRGIQAAVKSAKASIDTGTVVDTPGTGDESNMAPGDNTPY